MNSIKCLQCGLVNWADSETCKRCQAVMQAPETAPPSGPDQAGWQPPSAYGSYPSYADYLPATGGMMTLASRGSRLAASLLDSACFVVPVLVLGILLVVLAGAVGVKGETLPLIMFGLFGLIVLFILVLQLYLLSKDGQTIGKKCLSIRIVNAETGVNGGFKTNALMRTIVPGIIGSIPMIGPLFRLVDILFIFREDQRCLHDIIAGTSVIKD